jgi:ribonucleotide reductase class II
MGAVAVQSSERVAGLNHPIMDIEARDRFHLDPAFLDQYRGQQPEWGPVGYVTYKRTYARPIGDDGAVEEFWQSCQRVVEGVYTVQKWHCRKNNLHWRDGKAQRSAQRMFALMWQFKFLPGGRGLWMMGTTYVEERGSAALNNCFSGETQLITAEFGPVAFDQVVGLKGLHVLTKEGWQKGEVSCFGNQSMQRVTFAPAGLTQGNVSKPFWRALRSNHREVVKVTPNHRWLLNDGKETTNLQVGDLVPAQANGENHKNTPDYKSGFQHGLVFADGTAGYKHVGANTRRYELRLCGDKKKFASLFENVTYPESYGGDAYAHLIDSHDLKAVPSITAMDYSRGFVDGWIAGDASEKPSGGWCLATQNQEAVDWLLKNAAFAGYIVTGINVDSVMETNFGQRTAPCHRISLTKGESAWKVVAIEKLEDEEPVYCATVPGVGAFTLANGIYTGNCAFVSTDEIGQDFAEPFCYLMDFSMLGVGVGGDCKGAGKVTIQRPIQGDDIHVVEDTREGWVELARRHLNAYAGIGTLPASIDTSNVRPYGAPIKSFGGTAAGPEPLLRLCREIRHVLDKLVGFPITSEAIVDLFDLIGVCVVAGNVRRCLPGDTLIQTENGLVPIKNIKVGDKVLTSGLKSDRFMPVTAFLDQGRQSLVEIKTQMGPFRCTPNHRVAVLTSCDSYDFKRAEQLEIGDRLVFVDHASETSDVGLPAWSYDKPAHSTTCKDITIPTLDSEMAWFLGLFLGDGYAYANRKENGFNAYISVAVGNDHTHDRIADRARNAITRFGVNLNEVDPSPDDNCRKIRAQSKQLAWYFDENFKRPNESLNVPNCVLNGSTATRAAFLAGLLDADGAIENRPTLLCASVYPKFLEQVQAVYASLGIPTRLKLGRDARGEWQTLYHLVLVGKDVKPRFQSMVMPHSVKRLPESGWESQFDYGYPLEWVKESIDYAAWKGKWTPTNKQMTVATFKDCGGETKGLTPIAVLDVSEIHGEHQTYDIEVAGAKEFVANGLLVHNSAIIMFGEADDANFLNLKNPEIAKEAMNTHRWASNNSIRAKVGMDYNPAAEILAKAGEPGFLWLENAHHQGRLGEKMDDSKACGTNPCGEIILEPYELCVGGKTQIQFDSGVASIESLVGKEIKVWNGDGWSTVKPRVTGHNRELLRVTLSDGSFLDCTGNHGWHVKPEGKRVFRRVEAKDLKPGDEPVEFTLGEIVGTAEPHAYEMGFFVGDGFVERQSQAATIPMYGQKLSLRDRKAISGTWRAEQTREGLADPYAWLILKDEIPTDRAVVLADKSGLPGFVFGLDRNSIREFVAGYIDSDGTVTNRGSRAEGYRIYGSEAQMRDLQILLRRANIDHATIRRFAQAGEETNYGVRNYDLWYCQIPSYECSEIPTRLKKAENIGPRYAVNNAHPAGEPIDRARKQKIVKVEKLTGLHTTYCFDEPENHMGVFANVLAYNCNLVETFPSRHTNFEDYKLTLKYAYLYAKTVSLIPTHNKRTNQVMLKNRRIGISQSGIVQSFVRHGRRGHFEMCKKGYDYLAHLDHQYSEWLCVRQSKRRTTVKPSGTVSLLPGVTPGIHYEHAEYYYRTIRVAKSSPLIAAYQKAGYRIEDDVYDKSGMTSVIYFPIKAAYFDRGKNDVTIWEQLENAAQMQQYWSDNSVSITVTFKESEKRDIARALELYETRLKTVSFLPLEEHGYAQAPYITIDEAEYEKAVAQLRAVDISAANHEETPRMCDGDTCMIIPKSQREKTIAI